MDVKQAAWTELGREMRIRSCSKSSAPHTGEFPIPRGPPSLPQGEGPPCPMATPPTASYPHRSLPTGIVASNTRDNNTGATYPHLNFSIPITVLQPALKQYSQTGDLCGLRELDHATEPVRVVWRLQRPLSEAPRSKL